MDVANYATLVDTRANGLQRVLEARPGDSQQGVGERLDQSRN